MAMLLSLVYGMLMVMKRWILISTGWVAIFIAVMATLFIFTDIFKSNPIPIDIRNRVDFATYYPSELPEGYAIQQNSYETSSSDVLLYRLTGPKNTKIFVSQQAPPSSFDFNDFHTKQIKNSRTAITQNGETIYLGMLEDNATASIRTPTTWILLTADKSAVPLENLEMIAKNFKT